MLYIYYHYSGDMGRPLARRNPCENFYEISARIEIAARFPHLAEITTEIAARSRRDTGNLGGQKLAAISLQFSPRCGKSRRPKTRRVLAEMREISAAKRSRRYSRRDAGNLGGQKRAAISPLFSPRCGKSRRPKTRRDLAAILAEIAARYGNLGRQIRGEMLQRDRGEIRKSRRPKRAVIAR